MVTKQVSRTINHGIKKNKFIFDLNKTNYFFNLLLSFKNYIDFLKSHENRDDTYILPVLLQLYSINIVIFENLENEIKVKVSDYSESKKMGFIYKRNNFYEPILYRYYNERNDMKVDEFIFERGKIVNKHYEFIIENIYQKIKAKKKKNHFEKYEKIRKCKILC